MPRRSQAAVAETRATVTQAAVDRASVDGLEGLTIGGLAGEVEMRKSSVFSLFGSKEDLQLATLEAAIEQFKYEVWGPVANERRGLARLLALCDSWLGYHEREVMPGGCFLTTATVEFDARPGPLRDAVARTIGGWLDLLGREVATAIEAGELPGRHGARRPRVPAQRAGRGGELRLSAVARPQGVRPGASLDATGSRRAARADRRVLDLVTASRGDG